MNEVVMLLGQKTKELLEYTFENHIPIDLCYMSNGIWKKSQAVLVQVDSMVITLQISRTAKTESTDLKKGRMIGLSFCDHTQNGHDHFIFGAEVVSVIVSADGLEEIIELAFPEEIEIVRNKSFLRTDVPSDMDIEVELKNRDCGGNTAEPANGRLVNLAANALCVIVDSDQNKVFERGQYIGITFTPAANETPISFNAYIRDVTDNFNDDSVGMEMEIVGLEASPEGRLILRRLCNVVTLYRKALMSLPAGRRQFI